MTSQPTQRQTIATLHALQRQRTDRKPSHLHAGSLGYIIIETLFNWTREEPIQDCPLAWIKKQIGHNKGIDGEIGRLVAKTYVSRLKRGHIRLENEGKLAFFDAFSRKLQKRKSQKRASRPYVRKTIFFEHGSHKYTFDSIHGRLLMLLYMARNECCGNDRLAAHTFVSVSFPDIETALSGYSSQGIKSALSALAYPKNTAERLIASDKPSFWHLTRRGVVAMRRAVENFQP